MTTIIEAANSNFPAQAAWKYLSAGISVIPCLGKQPNNVRWIDFQRWKPSHNQLLAWERQGKFQNVGIICGTVSGGLVVIDLDGENAVATFENRWPHLLDTFAVITGSGKGKHYYFYCEKLPPTTKVMALPSGGNIELKSNGQLLIAPPSTHPETGKRYEIAHPLPIKRVDLFPCREWILGLERQKHFVPADDLKKRDLHRSSGKRAMSSSGVVRGNRTMSVSEALWILQDEVSRVQSSTGGNRNNQLNGSAFNCGQLVADNLIPRWQVEDDLMAAAAACGLAEGESRRTIKSGLEAGMRNPRSLRNG